MEYDHPLEISNAGARLLAPVALSDPHAVIHVDALGVIERFTFAEVARQAAQWAQLLREKDLEPGDRVVVVAGREWGWRCALLGVLQAGGVGVPLPESTPVADIRAIAGAADAALLVSPRAWPDLVDRAGRPVLSADQLETVDEAEAWAHPPHQSMPGDVALILFARHAAGPRGAMHTHESLIAQAKAGEHWLGVGEDERLWSTATEGSAESTWLLLAAWRERASIVTVDLELDPGVQLELLGRLRLAAVWFSDAEYDALASMTAPPWVELEDSIRRALTTDESADGAIAFAGAFGAAVAPLFGLKELGVVAGWPGGSEGEALGGTGLPVAGIQLAIVDERGSELPAGQVGDVIVRGDAQSLFSGYIGGTAPRRDSWFDLGWQGALSADGRLRVVSRSPVETELVEAEVDLPGAELAPEVEPAVTAVAEPEPRSKRKAKRARREEERLANERRTAEERERREDQREAAAAAAEERRRTEAAREREAADAEERRRADQAAHAEAEKEGGRRQRREEKQARRREEQLAKEREKAEAAERARREAAEVEERKRADAEALAEERRRAKEEQARAKAEKRGPGRRQRREEKQARRREEQLAKERAKAEAAERAQREAAEAEERKRAEEAARAEDRRRVEEEKQREQERRREEKETRRREEQEAKEAARAERRAARAGARGRAEGSQPAETGRRRKRARRSEPVEQGEPERLSSDILSRINQYGMSNPPDAPDEAPDADASAQSQVAAEPNERGDAE